MIKIKRNKVVKQVELNEFFHRKYPPPQWVSFVEYCQGKSVNPFDVMAYVDKNLDKCPFCLRNHPFAGRIMKVNAGIVRSLC